MWLSAKVQPYGNR